MSTNTKPLHLIAIDGFKHEGRHYVPGEILRDADKDLALELAGAGRARLATSDELEAPKARQRQLAA